MGKFTIFDKIAFYYGDQGCFSNLSILGFMLMLRYKITTMTAFSGFIQPSLFSWTIER